MMARLLILVSALACGQFASASQCPDYASERLITVMSELIVLSEQIHAVAGTPSLEFQTQAVTLRSLLDDEDADLLGMACTLLTRYPSMEAAIFSAQRELNETGAIEQLAEIQRAIQDPARSPESGVCLDEQGFDAVRSTLFVLRLASFLFQAICDQFQCVDQACKIPCILVLVTDVVQLPFDATIATSNFTCGGNHFNEMTSFYEVSIGFSGFRGNAMTLEEITDNVTNEIVPIVQNATADLAQQDLLQSSNQQLNEYLDQSSELIESVDGTLETDIARGRNFHDALSRIGIERLLSPAVQTIPVSLQIPAASGGQLEQVREVVADAISNSRDAGIPLNQALQLFAMGDIALNQGKYQTAFESYRDAYRELLQ